MVDIYLLQTVAKATWIKRLSSIDQCHWKTLFLKIAQSEMPIPHSLVKRFSTP